MPSPVKLQFHLLPIRDWNSDKANCDFYLFILQFHLLPIRDWNVKNEQDTIIAVGRLQFHLLPIRDWNSEINRLIAEMQKAGLQFHLLPIRDWNCGYLSKPLKSPHIAISLTPY